jgi:sugar transferase (PEP-CTERM system associated)
MDGRAAVESSTSTSYLTSRRPFLTIGRFFFKLITSAAAGGSGGSGGVMSRSYLLMVGADFLLAITLLVIVNVLIIGTAISPETLAFVDPALLAGLCLVLLGTKYTVRLYRFYRYDKQEFSKAFMRIATATLLPVLIVVTIYSISQNIHFPPGVIDISLIVFCFIQLVIFYRVFLVGSLDQHENNVLVFGAGPLAVKIAEIVAEPDSHYNFCGFVQPEGFVAAQKSESPVESVEQILQTIKDENVSQIVVALSERRGVLPVRDMFSCKLRGVDVVDAVNFYEKSTGKLLLEHIRPGWFVFSEGFLVTRLMFMKQRIVDVLSAGILLFLTLPFFPLIALAIRLESPGDVFFRQQRVGFKEELFDLIKFRTMCDDAEKDSGAVWAQENDARVTRIGSLMRKFRIDELPQLFNVLKGEMSFIGPRPERPEFVARLNKKIPYYSRRHSVRPGLTGWAQIKYPYGASEEDATEKLRYDLYFIKNFSICLEFKIILGTFKVVLFGRGGR